MNKFEFIALYGTNSGLIFFLYQIPSFIIWQLYLQPIGQEMFSWIVVFLMALLWYWTKKPLRNYCYKLIINESVSLKDIPITRATSEYLVDSFDLEMLRVLDELREEKGDYLKVIPALLATIPEGEIIHRLANLRVLGLVKVQPSRVVLTPAGLEIITAPYISTKAILPPNFSAILTRARIMFDENNLNGVMDTINILFEDILRASLEEKFDEELDSKWEDLLKNGHVKVPLNRASLGVLLSACRQVGIVSRGSIPETLLGVFLKLRASGKHSTKEKSDPEKDARSSLELAQMFTRYWFSQ